MRQLKAVWVDAYHLELYRVGTQGWYAFDEEGDAAVMGPFASREECEHEIGAAEPGASQTLSMPIRPYLDGQRFDPETIRVMGLAFEMALTGLRLTDRSDLANELVAQKIIALAKAGELDPERLCDGVLLEFRTPTPNV
jgi:hypothetical protein